MTLPINTDKLGTLIEGRVEPHIYAFETQTVPNYLKVGDTYRPVSVRLKEWSTPFRDLKLLYTESARIDEQTVFRDFSVHRFLETVKRRYRLQPQDIPTLPYYSREFFKFTTPDDVKEAIMDIRKSAENNEGRYPLYDTSRLPKTFTYRRGACLTPRQNQQEVIDNFDRAVRKGRTNLLMYAVMRFGKSFTSMCCAKKMDAKRVLVVTAKADVKEEWKETVESIGNFEGYTFAEQADLQSDSQFLHKARQEGKRVVLFLTLQDLQGTELKEKHKEVFALGWDLLLVDETHFGARAEQYGKVLLDKKEDKRSLNAELRRQMKDVDTLDVVDEVVKQLRARVTIHLSGTPYRILMGSEFQDEDIIAFVQYSDIAKAKSEWDSKHRYDDEVEEWDNPYFGFPQMIRFAFQPNEASLNHLQQLKSEGATTSFSELFRPVSLSDMNNGYKQFVHPDEVLDLLLTIDGSKNDGNVFGFLDNERIKEGKLCRHMVFVLPYCASCDAMEEMLRANAGKFKNLQDYAVANISGVKREKRFSTTAGVKDFIADCENKGEKTITLTVNRMLTGNTVKQWDTMVFFKNTSSPEEYDQAAYRLQNPYVVNYTNKGTGKSIKFNMKPQTIFVDFDPERMFRLQEQKSQIHNLNTENHGNLRLRERIEEELACSPIIFVDHNCLCAATATNVMDAVRHYEQTRSVRDEATDAPIDMALLDVPEIRDVVNLLNPIGSKKGISTPAYGKDDNKDGDDLDPQVAGEGTTTGKTPQGKEEDENENEEKKLANKFRSYYMLILFFAFLTNDEVKSLEDIIRVLQSSDNNKRLSGNLGLRKGILAIIQEKGNGYVLRDLDYKIQNANSLIRDSHKEPMERVKIALAKFGRMSNSEIVTPAHVADEMVGYLPEDDATGGPIIDIASKQGEFAAALLRRFGNGISDKIYSICTSKLAYEFTRKVYELFSMPVEHIFDQFTSYDLIKPDNEQIITTLKNMNSSLIIGNPPYQIETKDTSDKPIYNLYIDLTTNLVPRSYLITPGRFLFNAGKTPKQWNKSFLSNPHFKVLSYKTTPEVFEYDVDIKGGIAVTHYDKKQNFGAIGTYSSYPQLNSILSKVVNTDIFKSIDSIIYSQNKFNLKALYADYPSYKDVIGSGGREKRLTTSIFQLDVFTVEKTSDEAVRILGLINNVRVYRYIKANYLDKHPNLYRYKVIIPKSNNNGVLGETLSNPLICAPHTGITQSFISFGAFDTEAEAQAALKYICSKFARALLGILKVTQDNSKDTWAFVPLQDFTSGSDIDWSASVEDIDRQLYRKYRLTDEETTFIERMIKPM